MKVFTPVPESLVYSKILFAINTRKIYSSELALELNKAQSVVIRQLKYLVKKSYLTEEEHPEKKKNIKLFSINWEMIVQDFLNLLEEELKEINPQLKRVLNLRSETPIKDTSISATSIAFLDNIDEIKEMLASLRKKEYINSVKRNIILNKIFTKSFQRVYRTQLIPKHLNDFFNIFLIRSDLLSPERLEKYKDYKKDYKNYSELYCVIQPLRYKLSLAEIFMGVREEMEKELS